MSFWGVLLEPTKSYTLRSHKRPVRISQATLGFCRVTWIKSRSVVRCAIGRQPPIAICSLTNRIHCCQLDLVFEELEDVVFTVDGAYSVYLSGYYLSSGTKSTLEVNLCESNVGLKNSKQAFEGTNTFVDASNEKSGRTMLRIEQESCSSKNKRRKEISTLKEDEHKAMNPSASIGCHKSITEKGSYKSSQPTNEVSHSHKLIKNVKKRKTESSQLVTQNRSSLASPKEINDSETSSDGLTIETLAEGNLDGKVASPGKKIKIKFNSKLRNSGIVIGEAVHKLHLGDKKVLKGLNIGINGMKVGEKRRLIIPPSLGFGKEARDQIPPNSWLQFDVDLVDVYE